MSKSDRENARIAKTAIANIFNNDDLQEVYDLLKQRWDINTKEQVNQFNELDLVDVKFSDGQVIRARVEKVNKKTVNIILLEKYQGKKYRVSPTYLTKITQEMLDEEEFNKVFF
jgi:predicted GNAT family N-acyltransferase